MKFLMKITGVVLLIAAGLWLVGFMVFVNGVFAYMNNNVVKVADNKVGIAVLTGGRHRIARGLQLLEQGGGERLLISGVQKGVTFSDIAAREEVVLYDDMPIDLGYEATDTVGNAKEIADWVKKHDFKQVIAVTSFYHIPRSRLELKHLLPELDIRFMAVGSEYVHEHWWMHWGSFKFLAEEYCKYLAVWGQYGF